MSEPVNYSSGQWVCGSVTQLTFHILINQSLIHLFSYITKGSLIDPGGGGGTPIWNRRGCTSEILNILTP